MSKALEAVFSAVSEPGLAETGGSHSLKGSEFQKNWAIVEMFSLYQQADREDFMLLFEAIQDVAVLDSATDPKSIDIVQVKKKDRGEWAWGVLTNLHTPPDPTKAVAKKAASKKTAGKTKPLSGVSDSPIGKLFSAMAALPELETSARFVSNAGCNIDLEVGGSAAAAERALCSELAPHFRVLLQSALDAVKKSGHPVPDLSKTRLDKVDLSVSNPADKSLAAAFSYLSTHSPSHAGQARAFVDSILVKLGPLGANTSKCSTFAELVEKQGFGMSHFRSALADLDQTPDLQAYFDEWLDEARKTGLSLMEATRIRTAFTAIYRRMLTSALLPDEPELVAACEHWVDANSNFEPLHAWLVGGVAQIEVDFLSMKTHELRAHLLLRAIYRCVDQN